MTVIVEGNLALEYEPRVVAVITNGDGQCVVVGAGEGPYGQAYREAVQAAEAHVNSGNYLGEDERLTFHPATAALVREVKESGMYHDPRQHGLKYGL